MNNKPILDVCCGGKMFYFDKHDPRVLFQDIRDLETTLCDGRHFEVKPDVQADFTNMPYPDNSFAMVVFNLLIWCTLVERNQKWLICTAACPRKPSLRGGSTSSMVHYTPIGVICWPRDLQNVSEC